MAQYLPLPDGNSLLMKEGETPQEAWARAQRQFPDSFKSKEPEAQPEGGFVAATKAGLASLKGDVAALAGRSGLMDQAAAEKYIKEQEEYKKRTFKPTEEGWTEAPVTKVKELLGGSLPYMAAPIAAGAVAPAGLASLGAVGAASALQFTGSNLSRQMDEGKKLGETELGYAAAAAIPQAALDVLSLKMLPGIRSIFAAAGKQVPEKALLEATKQSTAQIAKDYALATGKAMGTEGLTEAGQQVFERLQAGLNIADEKARDEYFDSFVGGAVLGGVLAPGGRYVERRGEAAKKQVPEQEEMKRLREEEEQRIEAEKQRKATPEYAQEVVQKYDELAKQRQDLVAQLKKVTKDSPTFDADKAFNTQINAQIKELNKEIAPLSEDYYKSKAMLGQMAEKERVAKLTPQEYAFGLEPETEEQKKARELEYYEQQIATPPKPAAELTPRQQVAEYADQRIALANDQLNTAATYSPKYKAEAIKDYTDYLMQDFTKAQQLVQTRPVLAGLPTDKEGKPLLRSEDIFNALKLRVGSEAKTATKQRAEEQLFDQQKLTQPKDQMAMFKESEAQVEEQKKNAEPNFDYLDPMFEKALNKEPVIKVSDKVKPIPRGEQIREKLDSLIAEADKADQDYRTARYAIPAQGKRGAPERAAAMEALTKGKLALEKIDQLSKEGGDYAREVVAARRQQQEAMAKLSDIAEQLRTERTLGKETERVRNPKTGEMETRPVEFGKGVAASTEQSLANQAEQVRSQLISSALQEAALHRRASGQPAITQDEALKAASTMFDAVNDWVARSKTKPTQPEFEEVIVQPAQMRANKIVRPAVTERRQVKGGTQAISQAEIAHFKERIKAAMRNLLEKPEVKATRVETGPLKRQFKETEAQKVAEARGETATTLKGELARRTEFVRNKMAKMGAMRPGARDALNAAADLMDEGKATRDILDKVEPVVDAIVAGRDVKQVDIQAIKDAIRATEEVPQGQKSLFPEAQEDLGYIRATPKNFANSPRMRPVWEALAKSRELASRAAQARAVRVAERDAAIEQVRKLRTQIDNIKKDTKFFWATASSETGGGLYSAEALAKVFARMPEAGNTPEEKVLLERYVKGEKLSAEDEVTAAKLLNAFRVKELPAYKKRLDEALRLLAQNERLEDTDNQLLGFMQDTNAQVRASAKELSNILKPLRDAITNIKESLYDSVVLTPEQRAMIKAEKNITKQRGKYGVAVEKAVKKARRDMDRAMGSLLDPVIAKTTKDLQAAEELLAKEKAELARITSHYDAVLKVWTGPMRDKLGTYELLMMEEKKDIVADLEKQVKEQSDALKEMVEERSTEYDGGYAVAQAMLDDKVKFERQYLEMLEANLATLRGESVLDKPGSYPFAYQQAKKHFDAQQKVVNAAEQRAEDFRKESKTDQQKLEDIWKTTFGGEGIKREEGKVERIQTTAEKEAEKLRVKAMEALDREEDAFLRTARKEAAFNQYVGDITDLMLEADSIPGPNDINELKKIINDDTQSDNTRIMAMAKVSALQSMESVEAQYEVEQEGKPKRKQKAATTLSSVGQAKGKPLRTGSVPASQSIKTLLSPERKRERMKDTLDLGAFVSSDDVRGIFGGGRTSVDFSEARTLFDLDFDAMSLGPTFTYKGTPVAELTDATERSLLGDLHSMYMRAASSDPKAKFDAAKSRVLVGLKSDANLYKNSNPTLSARIQKRIDFLESIKADDVVITVPGGGFRATATLAPAKLKEEAPLKVTDSQANSAFKQAGAAIDSDVGYNGLSFLQAAEYGAKHAKNANQKVLFERMQEIFADAKPDKYSGRVFASSKILNSIRGSAAGYYMPALDMVIVSEAKINPMQTLLHELVHAASIKMLAQDKALNNRVTVLRERVEQWSYTPEGEAWLEKNLKQSTFDDMPYFPDLYGLTNNKEFIAEVFANPEFQKVLAEIPSDMPRKSLLTRLVEFLSRSFSMPAKAMQSLFAESMALTEEILQRTKTEIYEANVDPRHTDLPAPLAIYDNPEFDKVRNTMRTVVAQNRSWWDQIKANTSGLAFATQLVDRFAGFERLAKYMDKIAGTQMLYYLRTYDQRMNLVSKTVADGAPVIKEVTRKDGYIERLVETSGGANISSIVKKLNEAKPYIGNGDAVNQVFTTYMAAIRAANKGIETLNFGKDKEGKPVLTQAMLDEVTTLVNNNRALKGIFEDARKEYNQYNRDMLDFVASTGALSKALVKKLVAEDDYIPFYRERKGVVELLIGNENPIRIGSIADQPYLQELVGGDSAILDFMTSSVQNTNMLMDMGLRNLATKNAVMELVDLGAAIVTKKPTDGTNVVKFKVEGDDRYAILSTEKVKIGSKEFETGVPADILVKGMEGIPTQMPFILRAMAMPAQVLRKAVTLSPLYMAKQLFRDSLAAPLLSGADFTPVIGALREINGASKETLEKRGIIGGQQFKGTSEDLSKILRDITEGQSGWMKALGKFEAMGMEADALTRRAQYSSYIEQGLSEMEATLMALESMNFNKRGASPSIHVANALIPFFNAQIQGLNVLYTAMSGKMPFNDQLRIREKLLMRGGMMAAATIIYAMMMQDDEAYKNATPDQKYGNWFIRIPGLDEPVKIPVPFEIGYVFKAIPEALYNSMTKEHGAEEAVQAFNQILINTIPGGSSMAAIDIGKGLKVPTLIPIPQAVKPIIELALEKSFFTQRDILSEREKQLLPEQQYRANTSEAAKLLGSTAGISPIKIEALVNGYTGTMGLAFLQAISLGVPAKETPEQAVRRLSEYPIVGGVFQPNDAGGIINSVYMRMNEIDRVKSTVDALIKEGKVQEANALITKRGTEYMQSELANTFKANMNMLTQAERAIAASDMTGEAKRKQLDDIRKMKIGLANATREISDKTIHLVGGS